jgi:PAS domain S-box-containing protein
LNEIEHSPLWSGPNPLLEALPGPAWIVECSSLQVLRSNAAARALSGDVKLATEFPIRLNDVLLQRLRSTQQQISFHASFNPEQSPWLFSAGLVPDSVPLQRLIVAQPVALFDVPAQLTFDELLDSAFDGLVILNADRRIVQISVRFQQMFGYTIDDLRGKTPEELVPTGYEHEFESGTEKLNHGGIQFLKTRRLRRDGTLLEVQVNSQPIVSGRFRGGLVVIYHDLTESNRQARYHDLRLESTRILATASTLEQASGELLPAIAKALSWDAIRLWLVDANGLTCECAHYATSCICGGKSKSICSECTSRVERVARDRCSVWISDAHPAESSAATADCKLPNCSLAAFPIMNTQQQVLGVLELLRPNPSLPQSEEYEILDGICAHLGQFVSRCKAELAMAESEAKFRTLAETAPVAIFIHVDGLILYANAASESIFGCSREELTNQSMWPRFHPEDVAELQERAELRLRGENVEKRWEARTIRKDGEVRWIDCSAALITIGNRPAIICVANDVTERRTLAIQLQQTQKMEAIGRLAGGIAHDFNNVLMVIGCCSDVIGEGQGLSDEVRKAAREIHLATERAAALTRQLLVFSRNKVLAPHIVDLNAVLSGTELILRRALGIDIALRIDLDPGTGSIMGDSSQIEQVVMNLAVNARHAMPLGGELSVSTSTEVLEAGSPQAGYSRTPGAYTVLTVADNGVGMNQEIQQHIFEPFFTTKGTGKGTGLGLSTVYGIVKQSGGFITVDSQPHCGAIFKVYFPIAAEESAAKETRKPSAGPFTILLVEDENEVRSLLHGSLERDGHNVLEASSGAHALEVIRAHKGKIDLLLTDIVMPGMSGRDLAEHLKPICPGLKVLYVSGYNEDAVLQKGIREGKLEFLQKPFPLSVLSRKVSQILSQ